MYKFELYICTWHN